MSTISFKDHSKHWDRCSSHRVAGHSARPCLGLLRNSLVALAFLALALGAATQVGAQVSFVGTQIDTMAAGLAAPAGVAVDGHGNVYIADTGNNRVVMVAAKGPSAGVPVTIASGLSNPGGVAADWSGNVYVADTGNNSIVVLPTIAGGYGSPVTLTPGLSAPLAVAVDLAGNIYVADTGNNRGVELPLMGSAVGTYGSPLVIASGLSAPGGIAVDSKHNVYFADTGNNRIAEAQLTAAGYAAVTTLRTAAAPTGVWVDNTFDVFFSDTGNNRVVELSWFAAARRFNNPVVLTNDLSSPGGLGVDGSGNVYVADTANNRAVEVMTQVTQFGSYPVNTAAAPQIYNFQVTSGTTIGSVGIYSQGVSGLDFTDAGASSCTAQTYAATTLCGVSVAFTPLGSGTRMGAVVVYDNMGNQLATVYIAGTGLAPSAIFIPGTDSTLGEQLSGPSGVAVDGNGDVFIADTGNNRVVEVPSTGNGYGAQITVPVNNLQSPLGMAFDGAGNLYVASNGNDSVIKMLGNNSTYLQQTKAGTAMYGPWDMAVDKDGTVYIANTLASAVKAVPWNGSGYGQEYSVPERYRFPESVAIDVRGNIFYSSPYMAAIIEVPWLGDHMGGEVQIVIPGLNAPMGIATDGNGDLYVLDEGRNRVVMLPWTGTTFGSQIIVAQGFNAPTALAIDGQGNLYVADTGNNQVVKVNLSAPPALSFANTYVGSTSSDSAQLVSVLSTGNQPLTMTSLSYPTDFPEATGKSGACAPGAGQSPGTTCVLPVNFTPQSAGAMLSESVSLSSNAVGMQGVSLVLPVSGASLGKSWQTISFPAMTPVPYGSSAVSLNAVASSGLPVSYTVLSGPGTLSGNGALVNITGAGVIVLQATQAGNGAFGAAASVTQNLTVLPAVLTVTPRNMSVVYGTAPAAFKYSVTGLMNGDLASQVISGAPVISVTGAKAAGIYAITASIGTLAAANYSFTTAPGTLTVAKAPLLIRPSNAGGVYGQPLPAFTLIATGLVNGDTLQTALSGTAQFTSAATLTSVPGNYVVSVAAGSMTSANYSLTMGDGTVAIGKAELTVSPKPVSVVYGNMPAAYAYTLTGFANGDTASVVTGTPAFHTTASADSPVGSYVVRATAGSLSARCYSFAGASSTLTVTKATLTVTAASLQMTYGGAIPALTYTVTGLAKGDTLSKAISGTPKLASAAITAAGKVNAAGVFPVTAAMGTMTAENYSFQLVPGSLTVAPAVLTVTANSTSTKQGTKLPALTYAVSGLANGDSVATATKGAAALTTTATSKSTAGKYSITAAAGTLAAHNYALKLVNGTLTITQ